MPVADTSRQAFRETAHARKTQEKRLINLYQLHPEGLSDRHAAVLLHWTPSNVSARRNGIRSMSEYEVFRVCKQRDPQTGKRVSLWGVRPAEPEPEQRQLEQKSMFEGAR